MPNPSARAVPCLTMHVLPAGKSRYSKRGEGMNFKMLGVVAAALVLGGPVLFGEPPTETPPLPGPTPVGTPPLFRPPLTGTPPLPGVPVGTPPQPSASPASTPHLR